MKSAGKKLNRARFAHAVSLAAVSLLARQAFGGSTPGEFTLSIAGSTALKNWLVKTDTFTDVEPYDGTADGSGQLDIAGVSYPTAGISYWTSGGVKYQVAPKSNTASGSTTSGAATALRVEFHESGSVEGILEMVNDQVGTVPYVMQNLDRNPDNGNAVWVNENQIGASGTGAGIAWTPSGGAVTPGGQTLGNFYGSGAVFNGTQTPTFTPNLPYQVAANAGAATSNGGTGQDAVALATSDAIPKQVFQNNSGPTAANPWNATPNNSGYGFGNPALPGGRSLGTAGSSFSYQPTSYLNYPGSGNPWNTAGLGNLNSQTVAYTATLFVANPGTGLTEVNRTDAQWLQMTGRLSNGALFDMTTRDVNSGTRNVAALNTGIDPTWAAGTNDNGNGNSAQGVIGQISIGPDFRFSNKTSGGSSLRPTVQNGRMTVGTLSINDSNGKANTSGAASPVRALLYADQTSPDSGDVGTAYSNAVQASYATISDGTYAITQQEQFVTAKATDSSYSTYTAGVTAGAPVISNILGDDSNHTVANVINNTLNSVVQEASLTSAANPADGLLSQGYLLPQLMQVKWNIDGVGKITPGNNLPVNGGNFNQSDYNSYVGSGLGGKLTNSAPVAVGAAEANSSFYGDQGDPSVIAAYNGKIYLTDNSANSGIAGDETKGNVLWGNFNQNGVRDYSAFKTAVVAAQALYDQYGAGGMDMTQGGVGATNAAKVSGGLNYTTPASLLAMQGQTGVSNGGAVVTSLGASKGDLIVMGDFNGDGKFDGKDLYEFADGAALADSTSVDTLTNSSTMYQTGILRKNAALGYLQTTTSDGTAASNFLRTSAQATFVVPTGGMAPSYVGATATDTGKASIDPGSNAVTGELYTWDPTGANSFNAVDVNHDGMMNLDDAFVVDKFVGESYSSLANQVSATISSNGTIDPTLANQVPFDLVNATLVDYGSNNPAVNKIQQGDMNVMNQALTGTFNYAWYNGETKVGSLNIVAAPAAGSKFQVPTGATFTISNGTFTAGGAVDPLTDSTSTGIDTSKSLNVVVNGTGSLVYAANTGSGFQVYKLNSLTVQAGGKAALSTAGSTPNRTLLAVGGLSFPNTTGTLDLNNNDLMIHNGNVSNVTAEIAQGQAGHWTGTVGITSSAAAATTNTALGVELNNDGSGNVLVSTFDGQPATTTDVLVKYTYAGDANMDGVVNGSDYTLIDNSFNSGAPATWRNGDFNYDGSINGDDYMLIDNSFNTEGSTSFAATPAGPAEMIASNTEIVADGVASPQVPEPASLGLLGIGAISLLGQRRRRR